MAQIAVVPSTADRFGDIARVINPTGREQACWCMHWRAPAKEDITTRGARLRELTEREPAPGMLAYLGDPGGAGAGESGTGEPGAEVAGWLGFSRRSDARALQRSRVLPAGEPETWTTTWVFMCVTVRAGFRRQVPVSAAFVGTVDMFERAGCYSSTGTTTHSSNVSLPRRSRYRTRSAVSSAAFSSL